MTGTTAVNALPYPEDTDAPNGPAQIKALAEALDALKWGSRNLKPTLGVIAASGDLTLASGYEDVPGASVELPAPAVASLLVVIATFNIDLASGPSEGYGTIRLDETDQTPYAKLECPAGTDVGGSHSQVYLLTLSVAKHTIKMRGKKGATNGGFIRQNHTRALYAQFAS
jgi:hypothetical protein